MSRESTSDAMSDYDILGDLSSRSWIPRFFPDCDRVCAMIFADGIPMIRAYGDTIAEALRYAYDTALAAESELMPEPDKRTKGAP